MSPVKRLHLSSATASFYLVRGLPYPFRKNTYTRIYTHTHAIVNRWDKHDSVVGYRCAISRSTRNHLHPDRYDCVTFSEVREPEVRHSGKGLRVHDGTSGWRHALRGEQGKLLPGSKRRKISGVSSPLIFHFCSWLMEIAREDKKDFDRNGGNGSPFSCNRVII